MERYQGNLILCSKCKRYLPRESFFEWLLRKSKYECKECHRKNVNEFNHRHGVKIREEQRRDQEENRQKRELERPLEPYEEINRMVEKVLRGLGEYRDKGEGICGYCDLQAKVHFNEKEYCRKHFLMYCLTEGKPLKSNSNLNTSEPNRIISILEELEELGVEL